jgi:hypothetical protein
MNSKGRPKKNRQELRIPANFERVVSDILNVKPAQKLQNKKVENRQDACVIAVNARPLLRLRTQKVVACEAALDKPL